MIKALFTLSTGMKAQQTYLDNVSNNLANINTPGFKRSQVNFQDLMYTNETNPGVLKLVVVLRYLPDCRLARV